MAVKMDFIFTRCSELQILKQAGCILSLNVEVVIWLSYGAISVQNCVLLTICICSKKSPFLTQH